MIFECVLPFPVSVNSMYGGGSGQKRFQSKKYKAWLASCPDLPALGINYPVSIEYVFTFPDKRERDILNFTKCIDDYLVKQNVITDDNYNILSAGSFRHEGVNKSAAGVVVRISSL